MAISFVAVPLYLKTMGEARYGVMAIFALLLGYFGFFDFGMSSAIAQRIAATDKTDVARRREIFWTGAMINGLLGLVGGIVILPCAWWYFGTQVKVEGGLKPEMFAAGPWLALAVPVALMTGVLRGALQGSERFRELSMISAGGAVLSQLMTLGVAWAITPSLAVVLPVLFITRFGVVAALLFAVLRHVVSGWAIRIDMARARDLFSYGGWVAISTIVSPLMTTLDRILIGSVLGLGQVSHYTVAYQLGERTVVFPMALGDALFPRLAAADDTTARDIAIRSVKIISVVMSLLMLVGIVILRPFLTLYISSDFATASTALGRVIFLGFALNSYGLCSLICLTAGGRPRMVAIAHLVEIVPFLVVLGFAMHMFGLIGVAIAFTLRVIVDSSLLCFFSGIARESLGLAIVPTLLLILGMVGAFATDKGYVWGMVLDGITIVGMTILARQRFDQENVRITMLFSRVRGRLSGERKA